MERYHKIAFSKLVVPFNVDLKIVQTYCFYDLTFVIVPINHMIFAVSLYHCFSEIGLGHIVTNCLDLQRYEVQGQWGLTPAQCLLTTSLALLASTLLLLSTSAHLGSQQLLSISHPPPRCFQCLCLPCSHQPRKVCGAGYA